MLAIKINNKNADLNPKMKIKLNFENPMFSESFMNQTYSYSWSIPITPTNQFLLKSAEKIDLYYKGFLLFNGYLDSWYDNGDNYIINLVNDGKKIKQGLQEIQLNQLDLDVIQVVDEAENAANKTLAWKALINSNLNEDPNTGAYKFPMIKSWGYNNYDQVDENPNRLHEFAGRVINRFGLETFKPNFPITDSYPYKDWITTVAPCPRVEYLLQKVFSFFSLRLRKNDLKDIPEYLQLFIFNNYVLDKQEMFGLYPWNIHGNSFDLKNHVANTNCYSLFELLNEVFDAYFIIEGKNLDILLPIAPIGNKNVTKYASEKFVNENQKEKGFVFSYNDEDIEAQRTPLSYEETVNGTIYDFLYTHQSVNYPTSSSYNTQIELKHAPLQTSSIGSEVGYITTLLDYLNYIALPFPLPYTLPGYGSAEYYAFSPFYLKSDEYENGAEIFQKLFFGLYRGKYSGFYPSWDEFGAYVPETSTFPPTPVVCNFKDAIWLNEETQDYDFETNHIFGKTSVFMNGPDNAFSAYKLKKLEILVGSTIKTKVLYFPLFELINLMKWKEIRHTFQQKKQSFVGFVKTFSFEVSNEGISPTEIDYIIPNLENKGSFSGDFNEDFD